MDDAGSIRWVVEPINQYIPRTPNRCIVFFIKKCLAHSCAENLPELSNVEVFLPPITTSRIQPLDAGIIVQVKRNFKFHLLLRIFENTEAERNSIYNIDILTPIRWVSEEWKAVLASCITNCFRHCFEQVGENNTQRGEKEMREQVETELNSNNISFSLFAIDSLRHPEGKDIMSRDMYFQD